ncbi:shikimate kinase [Chloroflexota bacterium]
MNIVLIGMRGCGKTMVGKLLAERLGKQFVEMDELIVQRAGLSIPEIVDRHGWEIFRDIEEEVTREVSELDNIVNATGGGVVTKRNNIRELRKKGKLVWLKANLDTLLRRIGDDQSRPSLTGKSQREDMEVVYTERRLLYERIADIIIDTMNKTPEEVVEIIVKLYTEQEFA